MYCTGNVLNHGQQKITKHKRKIKQKSTLEQSGKVVVRTRDDQQKTRWDDGHQHQR